MEKFNTRSNFCLKIVKVRIYINETFKQTIKTVIDNYTHRLISSKLITFFN